MPKKTSDYPRQLSYFVEGGFRERLIAVGYMMGDRGKYADSARNLLVLGINAKITEFSEWERGRYEAVLREVQGGRDRWDNFPQQVSYNVTDDIYHRLLAISVVMGTGGEYAAPARFLAERGIDIFLETLTERRRKDFEQVYENVVKSEEMDRELKK